MSIVESTGTVPSTGMTQASTGAATTGGSTMAAMIGWGDDWRQRMAARSTDMDKELNQLQRYESPEQIWRKARELERKMSSGEMRTTLKKDATPEETARWRQENGIPSKPEDYKVNMPQGKEPPKDDDGFLAAVRKSAHDQNFTQAQFDAMVSTFYAQVDQLETEQTEAARAAEQETEEKLRQIWGADYRMNKNMTEALLARAPAGFKDRFMNGRLADGTPIRASVEAWQWLVQLEREINPAATVVPGASGDLGKTIETELADLKKLMANPNSEYWKGPNAEKNQARYRQLVDANEKLKAKSA